jgi:hypothetical protein
MAAFRGFANSSVCSSVVLSAGYNPRLYAYIAQFDDFLPDAQGRLRKKVILKVSDLRSALIQGKILAKRACGCRSSDRIRAELWRACLRHRWHPVGSDPAGIPEKRGSHGDRIVRHVQ